MLYFHSMPFLFWFQTCWNILHWTKIGVFSNVFLWNFIFKEEFLLFYKIAAMNVKRMWEDLQVHLGMSLAMWAELLCEPKWRGLIAFLVFITEITNLHNDHSYPGRPLNNLQKLKLILTLFSWCLLFFIIVITALWINNPKAIIPLKDGNDDLNIGT